MIREKHTKSGNLFEADFYPIWTDGRKMPGRAPKEKRSTAAQQKYNDTMAKKKFIRIINANFDETDYYMHPTYQPDCAPQEEKQAQRDIANFFRRVKTKRKSELEKTKKNLAQAEKAAQKLPDHTYLQESVKKLKEKIKKLEQPLKYAYRIEQKKYKSGKYAGRLNWHFHLFLTGGLESREIETMWKNGIRTNCNHYQPEAFGPEAAALYMSKDTCEHSKICYSRNLDKPKTPPPKDGRITQRGVKAMATLRADDKQYWENRYKGYRFVRCYARYNEYNGNWYVSVVMYKSKIKPKWEVEEWITED